MIAISPAAHTGDLLRHLRQDRGLTIRQLAQLTYVSRSGVSKREHSRTIPVSALAEHVAPLGFTVALLPAGRRHDTGTGWPA